MRRRRPPGLTSEERKLWAQVARSVIPLKREAYQAALVLIEDRPWPASPVSPPS